MSRKSSPAANIMIIHEFNYYIRVKSVDSIPKITDIQINHLLRNGIFNNIASSVRLTINVIGIFFSWLTYQVQVNIKIYYPNA